MLPQSSLPITPMPLLLSTRIESFSLPRTMFTYPILTTTALLSSISIYLLYKSSFRSSSSPTTSSPSISSPSKDVPLSKSAKLPYPSDVFPGARDVQSPYGSLRVYEWGPESGRKVLFVHGMSVPCMSLGMFDQSSCGEVACGC